MLGGSLTGSSVFFLVAFLFVSGWWLGSRFLLVGWGVGLVVVGLAEWSGQNRGGEEE